MNRFHFKVAGYERGNRDAYGHVADDLRAANTDAMHEHLSINGVMDNLTKERSWRKPISKASKVMLTMGLLLWYITTTSAQSLGSLWNVSYKIDEANSAYLMLVPLMAGTVNQYILPVGTNNITIDITGYLSGQYAVILICNGEVVDFKNIIIN
ncbi:MAG: hypothetical protein LBR36_01075 [Bacteroidales bacterium]|jgi:hypothetical protein|nr:hypothetical protein [Bacteroidales bacterium]